MSQSYKKFIADANKSIHKVEAFVRKEALKGVVKPDHLCYKCESPHAFTAVREMLEKESLYVYESWIGGRLIALFRLKKPLSSRFGEISYFEVQDKKPNKKIKKGFTHIEFYPSKISYTKLIAMLEKRGVPLINDATPHHPIHEVQLYNGLTIRFEKELVMNKIKREEMI